MLWLVLSLGLTSAVHPGLQTLQKSFKNKQSIRASFHQKVVQDLFPNSPDEASGTMEFRRPDKLVWTYEKPRSRVIEYDGRQLKVKEDGRTEVQPVAGAVTLEQSFSFLWGEPDPKVFKIEHLSSQAFRVIPVRSDEVTFKYIDVTVAKGKVSQAKVFDKLGSTSIMTFTWP